WNGHFAVGDGSPEAIRAAAALACGAGNDVEVIAFFHEVPAVDLQLVPGFPVEVRRLGNDVGHDERRIAHRLVVRSVAVRAHVTAVEATVRVVAGLDLSKARRKRRIRIERALSRGFAEMLFSELPANPFRFAFAVV